MDVGDLGGAFSSLSGINASGVAVGMATQAGVLKGVRYDGTLHPLATLGGFSTTATAINAGGLIVGRHGTNASNQTFATRWTNDSTVNALGTLGGAWSMAWAVNTSGDIVGQSPNASGTPHAFLWKGGVMQDLNDLVDPASGWALAVAYGINDAGVIVGDGYLNGATRGFRLTISDGTVGCDGSGHQLGEGVTGRAVAAKQLRWSRVTADRGCDGRFRGRADLRAGTSLQQRPAPRRHAHHGTDDRAASRLEVQRERASLHADGAVHRRRGQHVDFSNVTVRVPKSAKRQVEREETEAGNAERMSPVSCFPFLADRFWSWFLVPTGAASASVRDSGSASEWSNDRGRVRMRVVGPVAIGNLRECEHGLAGALRRPHPSARRSIPRSADSSPI